MVMEGEAALRV
jgi:hypothetical protein